MLLLAMLAVWGVYGAGTTCYGYRVGLDVVVLARLVEEGNTRYVCM